METFAILLLIHLIGLIVCGYVLRTQLPRAIIRIVRKNSTRMDGSISKGRKQVELESLNRAFVRVDVGLVVLFVLTAFAGLITVGAEWPLPDFEANLGSEFEPYYVEASEEKPFSNFQWPLVAVYLVSSFLVAPKLISNLYQSAIKQYTWRANARFMDYYRTESLNTFQATAPTSKSSPPIVEEIEVSG